MFSFSRKQKLSDVDEYALEWEKFQRSIARTTAPRRFVLKGAGLGILSASLSQIIAACSGGSNDSDNGQSTQPGTGGGSQSEGVTGDWDTTGTPPYTQGLSDDDAAISDIWKQYPWYYKYHPARYNFDVPIWRGGTLSLDGPGTNRFDPLRGFNSPGYYWSKLFFRSTREGSDFSKPMVEPELALKSEHNDDYTSWVFEIPTNAKFHDIAPVNGRLMTAEDVAWSHENIRQNSVQKAVLRLVERISAPDMNHVRFDLKQPQVDFEYTLAHPTMHVIAQEHFENQDLFVTRPIGTGPFQVNFNEYQNRQQMVANKEYFRPEHPHAPQKYGRIPLLDEINITYHASRVAGKEAFLNGEIDFYQPSGTLDTALSRELLDKVRDALCFAVHFWACCPLGLYFQYKNPIFQDIRVRQAISLGIDRQKVWEGGLEKTGLPGGGPVALYYTGQAENPPPVEDYGANATYDPERAKQLLREAGLEPPLKLSVYETVGGISADFHAALEAVVFSLRQSGVADISIVERDAVVFANDRLTGSFPDLMYNTPGTLTFGLTLDSAVGPVMRTGSPNNPGSLSDPELDALLDKYSLLVNPDDAIRTAKEIQQRIVDNVDNVWFGWVGGLMIAQNWFKGQLVSPDGFVTGAATSNVKYTWIDDTAPGGRAGTEKVSG